MAVGPIPLNPSQWLGTQRPLTPDSVGPGSPPKDTQPVQETLKQLGYKIETKEDQADTYGASTQTAVRQFQKDHDLPQTGVADGQTQVAMLQALRDKQQAEREKDAFMSNIGKAKLF
jgi:peptidoglycan hydrolase-like protein with peptidoglycan-binding domain